uniref:Uncharacterized protein n=1 Tax=Myoviridae sp. ctYzH9 TaxID=2825126 RepID=A0A8S5Q585_9CAUD|nr:MAG TPA: hypothetical protein [Myoviridae sp. ctYzH9]
MIDRINTYERPLSRQFKECPTHVFYVYCLLRLLENSVFIGVL